MKLNLVERYARMAQFKNQRAQLVLSLHQADADFRFEVACLGLREVMNRYSRHELWLRYNTLTSNSTGPTGPTGAVGVSGGAGGSCGTISSMGGGGGSGGTIFINKPRFKTNYLL